MGNFTIQGFFRWYNHGGQDKTVFYPDGKSRIQTHNDKYANGGV